VPTYHRPYSLCYDYLKTPDGWFIPDFYEFSGEDDRIAVEHISIYLSQLGFAGKEGYMRVQNFPLSLTGIAFAWFTSLSQCTVGSWSQLEEQFYEYFGKINEKRPIIIESSTKRGLLIGMKERIDLDISKDSATKAKQHNILSESITYQKISLAIEKYGKRQKPTRLDFSGAKGIIHLSCDYHIIDRDQAPTSNKEGLPTYSELAEPTPICSKSAKPTVQLARPLPLSPALSRLGRLPSRPS
jgi:hypothetical protein